MTPPFAVPRSVITGLLSRCPRCGKGRLFHGFLDLAESCNVCGLDYGFADPADGPAFFVMTGVGILVMGFWAWWAVVSQPPAWLQYLAIMVALVGGSLATLRPVKAWLIAEQYNHNAGEGRLIDGPSLSEEEVAPDHVSVPSDPATDA